MRNLKSSVIAFLVAVFALPVSTVGTAQAGDVIGEPGFRGWSIGIIANRMDLSAQGHEAEGVYGINKNNIDDINSYTEDKSFDFPSAFLEYSGGGVISWTAGIEHIPGEHALSKKSRTDSADGNTGGNDSDHGERTAAAEVSDLFTVYFEPGIQFNDYIGIYGKLGGTHMTVDITQTGKNNSSYKDRDVWGGVYGAGIKMVSPVGIFFKLEATETRFRVMEWQSAQNRIRAKNSMSSARLAIGYNF